jgi:hypothetical protein
LEPEPDIAVITAGSTLESRFYKDISFPVWRVEYMVMPPLAFQYRSLSSLHFWVREKKDSSAEVDFLFIFDGKLIRSW